jgi:uncharacterized protein
LSPAKLSRLAGEAAVFEVATAENLIAGFLLGFGPQADYDSPNFLWFKARYRDFLYVDRIVISDKFRGQHLASGFYERFETQAAAHNVGRVVCEVNLEPPNPASLHFHQKRGFIEVGRQSIPSDEKSEHSKMVSLLVKTLIPV